MLSAEVLTAGLVQSGHVDGTRTNRSEGSGVSFENGRWKYLPRRDDLEKVLDDSSLM